MILGAFKHNTTKEPMSLYAEYLKERTHDEILERDYGFATYRYLADNKTVYVIDIYVVPESRHQGVAADMADAVADIARAKGCTEMVGTIQPSAKGSTEGAKVLLAYGMALQSATQDCIVFHKRIV